VVVPFPSPLAPAVFAATDEFGNMIIMLKRQKKLLTELVILTALIANDI